MLHTLTATTGPINTDGLNQLGLNVLGLVILAVVVVLAFALIKRKLSILLFGVAGLLVIGLMLALRDPARLQAAGNSMAALLFNF